MNRKPLEGIEALMLAIGTAIGYIMAVQDYSWWIVAIVVFVLGAILSGIVEFLKKKNIERSV